MKRIRSYFSVHLGGLIAAGTGFWLAAWAALIPGLSGLELEMFQAVYGLPDWLRAPMLIITQFGSAGALAASVIALYVQRMRRLAAHLLVTGLTTYVLVIVLKHLIARPRPYGLLETVTDREILVSGFGFPSGHTAMAAAISLTLALRLGGHWRWLPLLWIPLVALSRIYLGVHSPLDVLGGAAVGVFVVLAVQIGWQVIHRQAKH